MELAYSTPFFTTTNDTIQILNSLENPLELILDNKLEIVNGYLNALKNHNAEQLQISQSDYMQKQQNLQKMKEGMIGIYKIIKQKNPTLLAYKENGEITTEKIKNQEEQELKTLLSATNNNTDTTTSSLAIDPSAYIKGIFVKNNKGSLTKAVYSEKQTNKI
ncbi:hypothetical protein IJM86_01100 [bacterium]|nr:hypothetical protein [bacterium]